MIDNLRDVYNKIAPSWYNYRHRTRFRSELETLAADWQSGKLLNIGCGHGADFLPFTSGFELHGIDFSDGMIKQARRYVEKYKFTANLIVADACSLPYRNDCFDYVVAVATYHHLTKEQILPAIFELKRILRPGGRAYITVWNRWQPRFWFKRSDILVSWRTKGETLYRYYHLFSSGEFVNLAKKGGFEIVGVSMHNPQPVPLKFFSRNICLLLKKKENEA